MKKNIKFLLPVLAASLLLAMSSVSCASNVKGKTFKHEKEDMTISFTTKSDFVFKVKGVETTKGTYKVAKKVITCKFTLKHPQTGEITCKFTTKHTHKHGRCFRVNINSILSMQKR